MVLSLKAAEHSFFRNALSLYYYLTSLSRKDMQKNAQKFSVEVYSTFVTF